MEVVEEAEAKAFTGPPAEEPLDFLDFGMGKEGIDGEFGKGGGCLLWGVGRGESFCDGLLWY